MTQPRSLLIILFAIACKGPQGDIGPQGTAGDPGDDGAPGVAGDPGADALTTGTVAGSVKDDAGLALDGVAISTDPESVTATTASDGSFTLTDVPLGSYTIYASLDGYEDSTLAAVGVAAGSTTNVSLAMVAESATSGTILGVIYRADGDPLEGAVVSVDDGTYSTTTDASGAYTLEGVPTGFWFVQVEPPDLNTFLATASRDAVYVIGGATSSANDFTVSGRPTDSATYKGTSACVVCHSDEGDDEEHSAHSRSIGETTDRIVAPWLWPDVGGTEETGVSGVSPTDGATNVSWYACQPSAGTYTFKAGGTADCNAEDGVMLSIDLLYGGEGDGGVDDEPNLGVWKQRFMTTVTNVAAADSWTYTSGKDKDTLIMPVQITQSGDDTPKWGSYHGSNWTSRGRTFSAKCSGCHNNGLEIEYDSSNYITSYDYVDLNIGCESCHGPGSDHVAASSDEKPNYIVSLRRLTPAAERQACGMCHAADLGTSANPSGAFGYPFNEDNADLVGGGLYVPGVYDAADYIKGYGATEEAGGGFEAWPDGVHGLAHRQQVPMLEASIHTNNDYEQLTCSSCHDSHSLVQGPAEAEVDKNDGAYAYTNPTFDDNTLCLSCHAGYGPFADVLGLDVALNFAQGGGTVTQDGVEVDTDAYGSDELLEARQAVALAVGWHMQETAGMGMAAYNPTNDEMPVGRCASCHMPKTAKSGGYTTGVDASGASALVEGDQGSHVFDIIWPAQSAVLKSSTSSDNDIMPNSCGSCHPGARLSGD